MSMTHPTPDAAIRAALRDPSIGIDYARVPGDRHEAEEALLSRTLTLAVLGQLEERERQVVQAYALGASYRRIGVLMRPRISERTVRRIHRPAWERVRARLIALEIVAP